MIFPPAPQRSRVIVDQFSVVVGVRSLWTVSFEVVSGTAMCIVGRNGSGKSLLLAALARKVQPLGGGLVYHGFDESSVFHSADELQVVKTSSTPSAALVDRWPATSGDSNDIARSIRDCGIDPDCPTDLLSPGQQQRLVLLRASRSESNLFLLDSPSEGLDTDGRQFALQTVRQLVARGAIVILATSDPELLVEFSEASIWALRAGGIVEVREAAQQLPI